MRTLVAVPVFNEQKYVARVLERLREHHEADVLMIDDGSTDATPQLLSTFPVEVIRHATNRGYGRSMQDAFRFAAVDGFDWVITMDCDEQHEPESLADFRRAIAEDDADIISGSRYLRSVDDSGDSGDGTPGADEADDTETLGPPPDRREINGLITAELNDRLGLSLTDAFCGFKAYRVRSLAGLTLDEDGYAFPMQFWVQAVAAGLRIAEVPVKLIYNDLQRSFGGPLDDRDIRLAHYRRVLHCELERCAGRLPAGAAEGAQAGCC
ncbi:MAG: glycosyltransferase family 2 protein [Planctomycetota bacterium]